MPQTPDDHWAMYMATGHKTIAAVCRAMDGWYRADDRVQYARITIKDSHFTVRSKRFRPDDPPAPKAVAAELVATMKRAADYASTPDQHLGFSDPIIGYDQYSGEFWIAVPCMTLTGQVDRAFA